jgi:polar amino acid transport system substrate-binding protein
MKKRHLFTMVVAVASLLATTVVSVPSANATQGTLADILKRGKLVVGTGSGNPPFHFLDTTGKLVGMDIDVSKAIAKGLFGDESKIEFVQQASDSRIPNIVSGKVDITCQFMTVTAGRAQQVAFTDPYYREGVGLLLKKGGKYKNYAALLKAGSAARISILQNVTAADYVKKALPKAKVLQYAETALIYTAVDAGRADAAAADQSAIAWLVANNPTKYVDSGYGWMPQTYSCALKQGDQVWLNFVNQILNESMSGVDFDAYAASFKKWFGVTLPPPKIGFPR